MSSLFFHRIYLSSIAPTRVYWNCLPFTCLYHQRNRLQLEVSRVIVSSNILPVPNSIWQLMHAQKLIGWINKWLNKLVQTSCENLKERVKKIVPGLTWPFVPMVAWDSSTLSPSQSSIFNPCSRGQARSAQAGSPFSSGKVFTAPILHSFASSVVSEAKSFWDLY